MADADVTELIEAAHAALGTFELSDPDFSAGSVACALRTRSGSVFTGISVDLACGIGFCAEHAAVAEMLKSREVEIEMIVAVNSRGVLPPCGRCRELMIQLSAANGATRIALPGGRIGRLRDLLPEHWLE